MTSNSGVYETNGDLNYIDNNTKILYYLLPDTSLSNNIVVSINEYDWCGKPSFSKLWNNARICKTN